MTTSAKPASVAQVDHLVDEKGSRIDVDDGTTVRAAGGVDPTVGGTGPSNWWRTGLVALFIVAAILLVLQLLNGNRQTEMIPGTPVTAPQTDTLPAQ
ncbi:MAG TPA: hypothetical protein VFE52_03125 [Devosia sp.]|jgi:hypothetical protein|nr:hypothetical protein [Devosia sp.]